MQRTMNTISKPLVGLLVGGLMLAPVFALANNHSEDGGGNPHVQVMQGARDNDTPHSVGSEVSIQINANGKALVRGAKVTAVSSSTITATTMWGTTSLTWSIVTNPATNLVFKGGRPMPQGGIMVGDIISFNGPVETTVSALTVDATVVKDWSKTKGTTPTPIPGTKDTFHGTLQMVSTTTLPASLTLAMGGTSYTVNLSASTLVLANNWATTSLSLFVPGDTIRIFGTMTGTTTLTALVVRNTSR